MTADRQVQNGDKHVNFANIARLWTAYIHAKTCSQWGQRITAEDVANMMELMKIARRLNGSFTIDDYIDGAGYAACAGEIAAKASVA